MPKRRSRAGHKPRAEQPAAATPIDRAPDSPPETTPTPSPSVAPVAAEPIIPSATLAHAMGEVLAQNARRVAIEEAPPPPPSVPSGWLAAALGSWLVVAWLMLASPAIVRGPAERPWQPLTAQREASLRYGLWLARDRVEGFRRANGRLPSFLAEAGVSDSSLSLVVEGERNYSIEGQDGPMQLNLHSAMAADSFLGASLRQLRTN